MYSRISVAVPLTEVGLGEVAAWDSMYTAEADWLETVLFGLGLPSLAEVMAGPC